MFPDLKSIRRTKLPHNCNVIDNPILERVDANYNHLALRYKVEKENTNKDFLTGKTYHDAQIEIMYNAGILTFIDTHSTSATYKMNLNYYQDLEKTLKKNNLLVEDFQSIKFLDFSNNRRIQFLLSFLKLRSSMSIAVKNMTLENMKFRADDSISDLPKDLESLKGRVHNLNLHGKELNDTIYLSDENYRNGILCEKMRFSINYSYINRKGICYVEVAFSNALGIKGYNDTEFQISITPANNSYDTNFASTKIAVAKEINRIKDESYQKFRQAKIQVALTEL